MRGAAPRTAGLPERPAPPPPVSAPPLPGERSHVASGKPHRTPRRDPLGDRLSGTSKGAQGRRPTPHR